MRVGMNHKTPCNSLSARYKKSFFRAKSFKKYFPRLSLRVISHRAAKLAPATARTARTDRLTCSPVGDLRNDAAELVGWEERACRQGAVSDMVYRLPELGPQSVELTRISLSA